MKYLYIAAIVFLTACALKTETEYQLNDDVAVLAVGNDATDSMMTAIAEAFKREKNIELDFSKSEFDAAGKIEYLNLKIKLGSTVGGVESPSVSNGEHRYGFKVDYNAEGGTTLKTGKVDDFNF